MRAKEVRLSILRQWRENTLGYGTAVCRLVDTGLTLEQAHQILTRT